MKSHITGGPTDLIFRAQIMGKYDVAYFRCQETGYIQTEKPHWLQEAYASPINVTDTGIIARNSRFVGVVGALLFSFFGAGSRFLDYGGGYGLFTRMMRDAGFDFLWQDRYSPNLFARGFEHGATSGSVASVSAFEVFEHLVEPRADLEPIFGISRNVVFSTLLLPSPAPGSRDWWYYALEHGQHVSFYTLGALEHLARENGLAFATNRNDLHMFLESDLVPHAMVGRWLRHWALGKPRDASKLLWRAYDFTPHQYPGGGVRQKLRNLDQRRTFDGLFHLKKDLPTDELSSLGGMGLGQAYASHLLTSGGNYWPWLREYLEPKTMNDMLMLREKEKIITAATGGGSPSG